MVKDLGQNSEQKHTGDYLEIWPEMEKDVPLPVHMILVLLKANKNGRFLGELAERLYFAKGWYFKENQTKKYSHMIKKFISIGTKDGKLNPATAVMSAFALRLHTNLPESQFVSNEMWHSNHYEAGYF